MLRFSRLAMNPSLTRRAVASLSGAPSRCSPRAATSATARRLHTSHLLRASGQSAEAGAAAAAAAAPSSARQPAESRPQEARKELSAATPLTTSKESPASENRASPAAGSSSSGESAASSAAEGSSNSTTASTVADMMASPESAMRRLFTSWQQGVVASIGAVMGIGFLLYFLYTPVKEDTVHHTAVVASEALADVRLKGQAVQLSKDVVLEVLRDPKSLDAAVDVVVQLLGREETKIAVSSLLQSLFEDHYTQEVTKKFVLQVVQDPWIQDQLQGITEEQVRKLLRNPELKAALSDFLLRSAVDSLEKPQFHYEVARAVRHSAASILNFWWS